ncbi:SRPBCC family protein [Nonomuraea roseoviolacea]|uniref:Uncharacterized protein YndB with AHSA1/START domain n=1 Tax=Nonomuraea roseoviolacea subsp. carminata TaxID=160689 RepID=A0ABT1KBA0_9ACTN|nr:SRPBCC domain-containing protein [Nonomuraea roseoviolacea]MCP2351284.1 uncharacterized protein YndB with AHSA1/START domain [Nonomuraea roseoviolacea subsp. carminata]
MTESATTPGATTEFTIVRLLDAPRDLVFRAWTEPGHLTHWFGPRALTTPLSMISTDVRPGGAWGLSVVDGEGNAYPLSGSYREIVPPERLVFTTGDPANGEGALASVVTLTLADLDGKTEMRFHQAGVNTDEAHAEASKAGWVEFFDRLAEHLAAHADSRGVARRLGDSPM